MRGVLFSAGHVMLRRAVQREVLRARCAELHMKYTRRREIKLRGRGAVHNPAEDCVAPTALG